MSFMATYSSATRSFALTDESTMVEFFELDLSGVPGVTPAMLDRALESNGFIRNDSDWVQSGDLLICWPNEL